MKLTPVMERFILHWGEMGTRWGINRTVAQIHALLFVSGKPLHAEEIADTLSIARSNVSTSLRELQNWGIVKVVHLLGDRRDHFETMKDVWQMFRIVLEERKRREIDPTITVLAECVAEAEKSSDSETYQRLQELQSFLETVSNWYEQVKKMPTASLIKIIKLGGRVQRLIGS
jgi:DNA-binding transcriptional regulator GbsR (MarR family)